MITIRAAEEADRVAIRAVEERAFDRPDEADLVERLVAAGDTVLELVAVLGDTVVGHALFSRLAVNDDGARFPALALAPVAVDRAHRGQGIGGALVSEGHRRLAEAGERLCVVLGDPAYYARFGYARERARQFESDYQCDALQALAWGEAPSKGRLHYAAAFSGL